MHFLRGRRFQSLAVVAFTGQAAASYNASSNATTLNYVTLEEHWVAPALKELGLANPVLQLLINASFGPVIGEDLADVGSIRLANMTDNGIRKQVISSIPVPSALDQPDIVAEANDQLAAAIADYPDRFNGWAYLPMAYPDIAAQELERCVSELGFVGALIDNRLGNYTNYDGFAFWSFWEKVQELDVPVYLHPTFPNESAVTDLGEGIYAPAYPQNYPIASATDLGTVAWGFHEDTGLTFLRLYSAGIFAQFPNLKIILGHMGEVMPFMLARADSFLSPQNTTRPTLVDTWKKNVWVTTSGFFSLDPFTTVLRTTAIDRIMYSVDYPFSSSVDGAKFMADLKSSGMVTEEEWEQIAHGNAEELLGIS